MKSLFLVILAFSFSSYSGQYPSKPDPLLTPGEFCHDPYFMTIPTKVSICLREVTRETREAVIKNYVHKYGFRYDNVNYKIDHFIPLCMGGSNSIHNLWVQHKNIFSITDKFEFSLCVMMTEGRITHEKAVMLIKKIKSNPEKAGAIKSEFHIHLK